MHGIYFPEETLLRPGPVWQLGKRIVVGEISSLLRRIGSFKDTVEHRIGQALVIDRLLDHHTSPAEGPGSRRRPHKNILPGIYTGRMFCSLSKKLRFCAAYEQGLQGSSRTARDYFK